MYGLSNIFLQDTFFNVNNGVLPSRDFSVCSALLLFACPNSNQSRSRKLTGREPNASARRLARPSLGKEASALFLLAGATHCALLTDNQ